MERSRGGVCRHGGSFPIAFRCVAISWFRLTRSQALRELYVQGRCMRSFPKCGLIHLSACQRCLDARAE